MITDVLLGGECPLPSGPDGPAAASPRAGIPWYAAKSLAALREQINAAAPGRSRVSDGTVGDTNHLAKGWTSSDHNPWYPLPSGGIVTAMDITHDPAGGMDCARLARDLIAGRDRRLKYVIWDGLIADHRAITRTFDGKKHTYSPWVWLPYSGPNRHSHHLHLSVLDSVICNDPSVWALPMFATPQQRRRQSVAYPLNPTRVPEGVGPEALPDGSWSAGEVTISTPGPAGGWPGRIVEHLTFGYRGGFIQEAWSGPSGKHYVARYDAGAKTGGRYVPGFATQSWELPKGDTHLTVRYATRAHGSVTAETER